MNAPAIDDRHAVNLRETPGPVLASSVLLWASAFVFMSLSAMGEDAGDVAMLLLGGLSAYHAMAVLRGDRLAIHAMKSLLFVVGVCQAVAAVIATGWAAGLVMELFEGVGRGGTVLPALAGGMIGFAAILWALWLSLQRPSVEQWVEAKA
ncbi:MAG: hypothetical protein AAFV43_16120 [Planctomycetota bacterium]